MVPRDSVHLVTEPDTLSAAERRLPAAMPLHAITVLHGEAGLRERLLLESGRFPAAERGRMVAALALMSRLHERDRRQREPYSCHPLRVTIRILSHYQVSDPDLACAALLHDTVEDHAGDIAPGGSRQDALTVLAGQFGARTAGLVAAGHQPAVGPRPGQARAVPRARRREPGGQPVGAGGQSIGFHGLCRPVDYAEPAWEGPVMRANAKKMSA